MRYLNGWHPFKSITFDQRAIQLSHVCNKHEKVRPNWGENWEGVSTASAHSIRSMMAER